ncbi:hypothetical protein [Zooshikella ganghwensis]|uniref:Uncharacterized protein n=1 Tax=Zooshikella ganghwensis TaxID=202772 RepID=A0A4P9VFU3_9GAMM|nr:hypothetical protein [Zooshikella ganghwensis]RDH41256.1 hypothetical protein B9G39_29550 [Zooshikella ganghwensis]
MTAKVEIKETRNNSRPFKPRCNIVIELLGQLHDRDIILEYSGVESYSFNGLKNPYNWGDTYHGDVAFHEVRISENGLIYHEILLASEAKYYIECKGFKCIEKIHT